MPYARIVTRKNGTVLRTVKLAEGQTTYAVDQIAAALDSIIENDREILKVEADYTDCYDSHTINGYDPKDNV